MKMKTKNIFEMSAFYDEHRENAKKIPVDKVILKEEIHLKGKFNPENKSRIKSEDLIIVAKPLKDGTYQLVTGWNAYHTAKHRKLETILCVVTDDNRKSFLKNNGFSFQNSVFKPKRAKGEQKLSAIIPESLDGAKNVPLEQVKIPDFFLNSPPKKAKINAKAEYYKQNKKLPQAVKLSASNVLYDGYATYLAAKQLGLKTIPAFIKKGKK